MTVTYTTQRQKPKKTHQLIPQEQQSDQCGYHTQPLEHEAYILGSNKDMKKPSQGVNRAKHWCHASRRTMRAYKVPSGKCLFQLFCQCQSSGVKT